MVEPGSNPGNLVLKVTRLTTRLNCLVEKVVKNNVLGISRKNEIIVLPQKESF